MKTCAPTEIDTHNVGNDFAVTSPSTPRSSTTPFSPTAVWARRVRYGPNNAPATVVEKAELAQSYIFHPKISRLSFLSVKVPLRLPLRSLRLCGKSAAHVYIYRRGAENAEITQRGSFII